MKADLRIAVAGLGAIGSSVAVALDSGAIPGAALVAVSAADHDKARRRAEAFATPVPVLPLEALPDVADIIVECLPSARVSDVAGPALRAGKTVIVLSAGALLNQPELIELAKSGTGQLLIPTGATLGLDAVAAAAEGEISSVRMVSRKPPAGFKGAPLVEKKGIDLDALTTPLKLFEGSAREAARDFPANLNVAVALSLAGIGPDRTMLEVWADPTISRNTHSIELVADSAVLRMEIENIPSENPKSSRITALSVLALLRKHVARVRVGT